MLLAACNNNTQPAPANPVTDQPNEEKRLKDAISKYPDSLLLKQTLVQYYRDSGNYVAALKEVDDQLGKDSMNASLWHIKAVIHFEDGDTIAAIRSFKKELLLFPNESAVVSLAMLYAQTKNPAAIEIADDLLKRDKINNQKLADYIKGLYYSFRNEKIKAIGFFDKCLALNYTFMDAYREKAIALYDLEKYSEALAVLDKAITLQNNFDEGYYYSGRCLEKLNRIPEAIQSYKNALVYDPEYMEAKEALTRLGVKN